MESLSRAMVHYLRHNPNAPLDDAAYTSVNHIFEIFNINRCTLDNIINLPTDKQRLFLSPCHNFIRAASGHSRPVQLHLLGSPITSPSSVKYCTHGTTRKSLTLIEKEGLQKMRRHYIHFAKNKTSVKKGSDVIITLDVPKYLRAGMKLYRLDDGNIAASGNRDNVIKPIYFL
ncbi:probable RNA 2'-phosphotransferase [Pecten maximus]|uniref:probable RNA 2'-phosphotransferase n=1 Tax=Pecten maximus TaxID=6579 RepID=UPI001458CC08|nr:probable RNA 2'-phosphotransferase [Pecten maximus]